MNLCLQMSESSYVAFVHKNIILIFFSVISVLELRYILLKLYVFVKYFNVIDENHIIFICYIVCACLK